MVASETCPACGASQWDPLFDKGEHTYLACEECGLARLDRVPEPSAAAGLYDRGYFHDGESPGSYSDYTGDEAIHRRNAGRRLSLLDEHLEREPGRLLDVGAATGYFLDEAREAGWEVAGVEVSPYAAEYARAELGLRIWPALDEALASGAGDLDAVTFFQVLEHLPCPSVALEKARELLRPDGLLVVETWDRGSRIARMSGRHWQQVTPPTVLYLFGDRSLCRLVRRQGFRVRWRGPTGKEVSLEHVGKLLGEKVPVLGAPLEAVLTRRPLSGVSVPYRLGDLVTLVAEPA